MESRLILEFHMARRRQLADAVVKAMIDIRPGGLFVRRARCRNLWDEACWALQESQDEEACDAAEMTISQLCAGHVDGMLIEELRLHCYFEDDDWTDDGRPWANEYLVVKDLSGKVRELACSRNLSELELK